MQWVGGREETLEKWFYVRRKEEIIGI